MALSGQMYPTARPKYDKGNILKKSAHGEICKFLVTCEASPSVVLVILTNPV